MSSVRSERNRAWMSAVPAALVSVGAVADTHVLENRAMARVLSSEAGRLATVRIENKLAGKTLTPASCPEFRLRISQGTHTVGTDVVLTAADFEVTGSDRIEDGVTFSLSHAERGLTVQVRYTLRPDDVYAHKQLTITSRKTVTLERIDVEALGVTDAYQPYTKDAITAHAPGNWSPNIGQPLYTRESGTFWGIEFPAARNQVQEGSLLTGYLWGRTLQPDKPYTTYAAVVGVSDDAALVSDAFQSYIRRMRCRPMRLQVQYNSWFDYGGGVDKSKFARSVAKIHEELTVIRGNRPLKRYVIDDGWQDVGADWSDNVWKVNRKFDPDFKTSRDACEAAGSGLGLWMSPGCLFGARGQVGKLRAQGFEAMDDWMSMAGPKYMQKLEERMAELVRGGVGFFKLDGVFGHLNLRNFELRGDRYGIPYMPQLELDGLKAGSRELNDAKYDELKLYYLTAGTERLIEIFDKLGAIDPEVYLLISNGAYLSPWWLMHVDAVWMINAGDAAGGSSRTQELVYRDGRYYKIFGEENTQFPLNAVFNHEPKKRKTGETKDVFRKYLYMNLSRATGFVELYIKPFALEAYDWDVLSEGLFWVEDVFPCFANARIHGGDPTKGEVYGYTGWTTGQGYVSLHNPSAAERAYSFRLDRNLGITPGTGPFLVSSPLDGSTQGVAQSVSFGDTVTVALDPGEIRVLNFDRAPRDWSKLKALQDRTPGPTPPPPPPPIKDHAILGVWQYTHQGVPHTRTFSEDGYCVLRSRDQIQWRKPFRADSPTQVTVEGGYLHVLNKDGTLRIESRYTARRGPQ